MPDLVGIVYYEDDPLKRVFRWVDPSDQAHLDGPALETDPAGGLRVMLDENGQPHGWHTFCTKAEYHPVFKKIPRNELAAQVRGGILDAEAAAKG